MISTMRTKVETIQQIDNVTDGVNLRAEAKRFTHRRCKVLTYCQFIKGGRVSPSKCRYGCAASAKSRPGKISPRKPNSRAKSVFMTGHVFMNFRLQKSQSFSTWPTFSTLFYQILHIFRQKLSKALAYVQTKFTS